MALPSARNWFSPPVLCIAGCGAFSTAVGLAGLYEVLITPALWVSSAAGAGIILASWYVAASQDRDNAASLAMTQSLLAKITERELRDSPTPVSLRDLRPLSAKHLKELVHEVASKMRAMEQTNKTASGRLLSSREADWDKRSNALINQSNEQSSRWRSDLRPDAMALRDELRRRVYGAPPYPQDRREMVALEHAMLAGVAPLTEAASYLEDLARQVPG